MYSVKPTALNNDIPQWLKPHMKLYCECGNPIVDDGPVDYRGVMKLTQRKCADPLCPYHMAEKMNLLAKRLDIKGIGSATCLDIIKQYNIKNHLEVLKMWFTEKLKVDLYEVGEMSYIYGIDSKWKELLAGYTSFEEFFENAYNIPEIVLNNKELLIHNQKYFNIKNKPMTRSVIRVMITGSIKGFSSRGEFLDTLNKHYEGKFRIEDNKKTVRGTLCLIKEPESVDYTKSDIAIKNGIPIVSSADFMKLLEEVVEDVDE